MRRDLVERRPLVLCAKPVNGDEQPELGRLEAERRDGVVIKLAEAPRRAAQCGVCAGDNEGCFRKDAGSDAVIRLIG